MNIINKADRFPSPNRYLKSTQWSERLSCKIVRHLCKTVAHCANLSQYRKTTERSENVALLCSTAWVHFTRPTGSVPEAPDIWIPPYYIWMVPMVSALQGFHALYFNSQITWKNPYVICKWICTIYCNQSDDLSSVIPRPLWEGQS